MKRKITNKIKIIISVILIIILACAGIFGYIKYTRRFDVSVGENSYCLEMVYCISCMMDKMGDESYVEQVSKILKSAEYYFDKDLMTAVDEESYLCLLSLIGEEELLYEKLDVFLERRIDENTGLIYEFSSVNTLEDQVGFTIQTLNRFEEAEVTVDKTQFQDGMMLYMQEAEFLFPEEDEDGLYLSGAAAIYGIYLVDPDYDFADYEDWYGSWKEYYANKEIADWDDYFDLINTMLIISEVFDDYEEFYQKAADFLTNEILQEYIDDDEGVDESWTYILFEDFAQDFDDEIKAQLIEAEKELLDYYFKRLKS